MGMCGGRDSKYSCIDSQVYTESINILRLSSSKYKFNCLYIFT